MKRIFLDTNIIIDFLGNRKPYYEDAAKIMTLADTSELQVFTSSNAIINTFYILRKQEAREIILEKIRKFKLICGISVLNDEIVTKSLYSNFSDIEDAMQYYSAIAENCDVIVTRNEKDFAKSALPIMNAENFLIYWGKKKKLDRNK